MSTVDSLRPSPADRRQYARVKDVSLMANVAGALVDVLDISLNGVSLAIGIDKIPAASASVEITLIPRKGRTLDVNHSLRVRGRVIRGDETSVAIAFERHTLALAKLVIAAMAENTGVEPFHVR